jgi:hypothetical protein
VNNGRDRNLAERIFDEFSASYHPLTIEAIIPLFGYGPAE